MNTADRMLAENPTVASGGHSAWKGSIGMMSSDGSGFHTNPIAARCGSRLNST